MKTTLLFASVILFNQYHTQTEQIDINNISATLETRGVLFNEFSTSSHGFEALKGDDTHTIFSSSLWMAGKDANNQIKGAFGTYGASTDSYITGPLTTIQGTGNDSTYDYGQALITAAQSQDYNNVYIITAIEVNEFITWYNCVADPNCNSGTSYPTYAIPSAISNWPAHGNVSAGQDFYLAPFVDVNGDQIYNPADGDYPRIKGDQYAWIITNDKNPNNTISDAIGVEIHTEIYSFIASASDPLSRTIFVNHDIINRSTNTIEDFYVGVITDFDIGCNTDDYVGSFPELNSFFGYNGSAIDMNCTLTQYTGTPPAQSTTILNTTLNKAIAINPNGASYNGTPTTSQDYYNYLQGKFIDGSTLMYGGDGHNSSTGVTSIGTNFHYPQNAPSGYADWTEVSQSNNPQERSMLGSVGPHSFTPGMKIELDLAYVYSRAANGNNLSSVNELENEIPMIQDFYDSLVDANNNVIAASIQKNQNIKINVYPNPFSEHLTFSSPDLQEIESFEFTDIYGRILKKGFLTQTDSKTINTSDLPTGLYFLNFLNKSQKILATHKLIKK